MDRDVRSKSGSAPGIRVVIAGLFGVALALSASVGNGTSSAGDGDAGAADTGSDEAVPSAEELFAALHKRYRELDTYRDEVRFVHITQKQGEEPVRTVRHELSVTWSRPNRLALENHHEVGTLTGLYCDGESLIEANMALEQYRQTDAPPTLAAIADRIDPADEPAQRAAGHPVLAILWGSRGFLRPDDFTIHRAVDDDNGRRLVGELLAGDDHLGGMRDAFDGDVLFPFTLVLDEDGLLRRTELDMTHAMRMLHDQLDEQPLIQDRRVMIIDRQPLDAPLDDDVFAYEPPENFRRIENADATGR